MAPSPIQALLGSQAAFTLSIDGVPDISKVVRFNGQESLSELFEIRLEVAGADVELATIVGKVACLKIDGLDTPRYFHGLIADAEYSGHSRRFALYSLTLVPEVWPLRLRQASRILQNKATPDVLREIFKLAGVPKSAVEYDLSASYAPRNYCVQYRETDFDFVSRLMEEDGIYYYFTHDDKATTMVIADYPGGHAAIPGTSTIQHVTSDRVQEREHIAHLRLVESMRPGRVSLRDINLHKPHESMDADAQADLDTDLEIYDYPGEYQDPGSGGPNLGQSIAKIRLEALRATRRQGMGESDSPRLSAGHVFTLEDHARQELNTDFAIVKVVHRGEQPQVLDQELDGNFFYGNTFTCIEKSVPFRPPRVTPRPAVRGVQSATVVGPGSEEIHTDAEGRVLVQFHWDRDGKRDENSSCWVRVSQAWAGATWGAFFIPRIGHEVLVDFIEGDPDRPVITGRIYHGGNTPPYPLPDEKTKSTIKSESSPGGGGFNELRFEDNKGGEEIYIHAQKDMNVEILHDNSISVGNDRSKTVGNNQSESVGVDKSIEVGSNHTESIGADKTLSVGGSHTESIGVDMGITIGSNLTETVAVDCSETIGANHTESTGANWTITVGSNKTETVSIACAESIGAAKALSIGAAYQVSVGGVMNETVGAAKMEEIGLAKVVGVGMSSSETVGMSKSVSAGKDIKHSAGKNVGVSAGEGMTLSAGKDVGVSAGKDMGISVSKKMNISAGDEVTLVCGGVKVMIKKNGDVSISAKKVGVKASGPVTIKGSKVSIN